MSRPDGSGLLTISRVNDFELIDRPAGPGLTLSTTTQEGVAACQHDSSILPSPGQVCGRTNTKPVTKGNRMYAPHPFELVIGLDRSDRTADLWVLDTRTGTRTHQSIGTAPEALGRWAEQLHAAQPQARVALCLEQPALNLIACLETYPWLVLYPINPVSLQNYRQALVTSRAKDDTKDARYLAEWLYHHHAELRPWTPDDRRTRWLQQLVAHRRAVVDERTALTNRLQALLKQYYPQALELCGEDLWRPLATAFLLKWPSLQALRRVRPATLKQFYYRHGSRSPRVLRKPLEVTSGRPAVGRGATCWGRL